MTYSVHPGAEIDLIDASDFYRKQAGEVVAKRFLAEFERVAQLVARKPDAGAEIRENRRRFHLSVFPYTVVYRKLGAGRGGDLQPLGVPQEFAQSSQSLRGGMTLRRYRIKFPNKTLRLTTFIMPDGKIEQYQIAAAE